MTFTPFELALTGTEPDQIASKEQLENGINLIASELDRNFQAGIAGGPIVGSWDASIGAFPTLRPNGTSIKIGDNWQVSVAGTVDGFSFVIGDYLQAMQNGGGVTFAGNWARGTLGELKKYAEMLSVRFSINIADFMAGLSDQAAFQAAVGSLPDVDNFSPTFGTLNNNELPTYEIIVPEKPQNLSTNTERYYVLTDNLNIGKRDIIWNVAPSARFGALNGGFQQLNSKVLYRGNVHIFGFSNQNKRTNFALTQGLAALSYAGMQAGISGYDPDTVATQAYQHERGAANLHMSISDTSEIKVPGAGVTFTSDKVLFAIPLSEANSDLLRIGMAVDTVGNMLSGVPVRHTSRITTFTLNGSGQCTEIFVQPWQKMVAVPPFESAVASTPANGTAVVINPVNKIWNSNANLFLNKTDGATYGYTSGSILEPGVFNNTGVRAGTEFDRDFHPFHIWGMDMPHGGDYGGGIAYIARGAQTWDRAFENRSAEIGFHNHGTVFNNGKIGFASSSGFDGIYAGWGTGTPISDYVARSFIGGVWDEQFRLVGGTPEIQLGRRGTASTPRIRFYSDGLSVGNDSAWDAEISVGAGGSFAQNSILDQIFSRAAAEKLRLTATGATITGLLSGTAVTQTALDNTAGRLLKVGDFGLGTTTVQLAGDCNTITLSGFYYADGATANKPAGNTGNWLIIHNSRLTTTATQIAISRTAVAGMGAIYRRVNDAGTWSNWVLVYDQTTILGTVSQSAGIPTGAIVERGSNANGEYVRYADGTQICTGLVVMPATATATGALFTNAAETAWTFPIAFATTAGLSTSATVRSSLDMWTKSRTVSTTVANLKSFTTVTSAATPSAEVMAIGRWF